MNIARKTRTARRVISWNYWKTSWTRNSKVYAMIIRYQVSGFIYVIDKANIKLFYWFGLEIAACLVRYLALVKEQKFDEIAAELLRLPACTHWLMPQFKVQYAPKADDDSSSDDDDDETDSDEEMEDDQPEKPTRKAKSQSKASGSGGMEVEEEDGWTTVRRKH